MKNRYERDSYLECDGEGCFITMEMKICVDGAVKPVYFFFKELKKGLVLDLHLL